MKTRSKIPKMLSLTVFLIFILSIVNSQLVLAEQFTFKYDSAGNMITGFNHYYEYDGFNQLSKVRENDETGRILEEYWYDDTGNRIKKVHYDEDGSKETFYYIGNDFVRKINSSGTYDTNYYYLGSELVAKKENSETLFFHPDHLGSTSLITDESGNAVEKTTYLPFGGVDEGGNEEERLYTGKEKDDTGLMYYGARYYSPFLMKFTQPDTLLPDVYDPQQLNRYSYARNNPYKYTDPSGNIVFVPFLIAGAIILLSEVIIIAAPHVLAAFAFQDYETYKEDPSAINTAIFASNFVGGEGIPGKSKVAKEVGKYSKKALSLAKKLGKAEKITDAKLLVKETSKIFDATTKKEVLEYVRRENLPNEARKTANDFFKGATNKANDFKITKTDSGYTYEFFSPADNPGYGKRYVLEADEAGKPIKEFRDTLGPQGLIERKFTPTPRRLS